MENYETITRLVEKFDFNLLDFIEEEVVNVIGKDELIGYLEELQQNNNEITKKEITYYYNAINFLSENDQTLTESLRIAQEYGYDIISLNSETLASLLATRYNEDDYSKFIEELEEELN